MFRGVIYCSGGPYAVQEGYMDVQRGYMLFRGVICCSGGLYGCSGTPSMRKGCDGEFRGVICCSVGLYGCSGGLYAVQGGYMRKIMMKIVVH